MSSAVYAVTLRSMRWQDFFRSSALPHATIGRAAWYMHADRGAHARQRGLYVCTLQLW
jgi:hypothetical protein